MRAGGSTDDVERVVHIGDPVAQRLVHRILKRVGTAGDRDDFGTEQLHAENIGLLPLDILSTHVNHARQAKARRNRSRGDAVLTGAGLGNDPRLAHPDRQQDLTDAIVDLVCTGVIELVALEPHLRAAELLGQARGEIERARPSDVMFEQIVEFRLEGRI